MPAIRSSSRPATTQQGADELVFLDITASSDQRDTTVEMARAVAEQVFIPFTIGGGIRTVDDARRLLQGRRRQGQRQHRGGEAPRAGLGDQPRVRCPVLRGGDRRPQQRRHGERVRGRTPTAAAPAPGSTPSSGRRECERLGAGEILLTSMDRDGTKDGFDLPLTSAVTDGRRHPGDRSRRRRHARAPGRRRDRRRRRRRARGEHLPLRRAHRRRGETSDCSPPG